MTGRVCVERRANPTPQGSGGLAHRGHGIAANGLTVGQAPAGGIQRWFVPLAPEMSESPAWRALLLGLAKVASALKGEQPWFIEAHQFRIDTTDGIGRPTPEGAHRDGVDLVAVFFVDRQNIKGGESRVFEARGPNGQRFTMSEPWTLLLLDDERVIHETTPIQPDVSPG